MHLRRIEHLEKPSTKMQNAHRTKTANMFFVFYN